MTRDELTARTRQVVADHLDQPREKVTTAARYVEDLGADSLDNVEIVMALEEEFDIEITDEDAIGVDTFGATVDYLAKRLGVQ